MAGRRKLMWLLCGFLAATALASIFEARDARAQSRIDTSIASPAIPAVDPDRAPLIRTLRGPVEPETRAQPVAVPEPLRDDGSGDQSGNDDDEGASLPSLNSRARRRVPQDGDLRPLRVPEQIDGVLGGAEPGAVLDGEDPTREDGRAAEDIAAFENPPAGFDPRAFSIELSPILDRRPRQLFLFAPYQPIGTRIGSFVLFSQVETGFSPTNNFFQATDERSDIAAEVAPSIRIVSNWRTHAVEFNAGGQASFHRDFSTEDDRIYRLEARGRLDITRRSNLETLVSRDVTQETRGSANSLSGAGQDRADITTDRVAATLNHRFNRLSLQLRGALINVDYDPTEVDTAVPPAAPVFVSIDDRDYDTRQVTARASWEFNPELTVFFEAGVNDRNYDVLQGGFDRDSRGERWRTGVSFGNDGPYLRGEISVGYGRQDPQSAALPVIEGVLLDSNLAWRFNDLTSLLFNAATEITETTIAGSSGGLTRNAGLSLRHAFRRNFIVTAGLNYSTVSYEGVAITESTTTAALGLEYSLNRNVVLFGDYEHVKFDSNQAESDYNRDELRLGVRLRR